MSEMAAQLAFPGPLRTQVIDDYGPVGKGASQGHFVLAENGNEYMIKGPALTPNHAYVAANELIAAQIAGSLGLPVLDYCIVETGGNVYSGSTVMPRGTFHAQTDATLFDSCLNADRVYDVVAFDAFVCNVDRHHENLLVRTRRPAGTQMDQNLLLLNDHSHCLVLPGADPASLAALLGTPPSAYVSLDFVRDRILHVSMLSNAIQKLENFDDQAILAIVNGLPGAFFPGAGQQDYVDFLIGRKAELRATFESGRAVFANLGGGKIL